MLLNDINNQFSPLLEKLADSFDISDSRYQEAIDRYKSIGEWLNREGSIIAKYQPEIYPQGSFRLGTVIKPVSNDEQYDIDLVCKLLITKSSISQSTLKKIVGEEVNKYIKKNGIKSPIEEGKRCWTVNYSDSSKFHMDILPAIPNAESYRLHLESINASNEWIDDAIGITDNTLSNYSKLDIDWPQSNPIGYCEWFKEQMKVRFDAQRKYIAESIKADVEDVPDYRVKTPLQRSIQLLKRHRDLMFVDDTDDKPISIIISTLAAHAYNNESDVFDSLLNISGNMSRYIEKRHGVDWVQNPVNPSENFADKWQEHPSRRQNFYTWMKQVSEDIQALRQSHSITGTRGLLEERFGKTYIDKVFPDGTEESSKTVAVKSRSTLPSRFDVPHKQPIQFPVINTGSVRIHAFVSRNGYRPVEIRSDSQSLPKHSTIRFKAKTNVNWPYKVYWQVVNTGYDAGSVNCLRGGFYDGEIKKGGKSRTETTLYAGMHWVECFIVKDSKCVARSGEFVVNIE